MNRKNIEILMIGPGSGKTESGGVVAVIDNILQHLDHELIVKRIVSTRPGAGILERLGLFSQTLFSILASLFNKNKKIAHVHLASRSSFYRKSFIVMFLKLCRIPIIIHLHGGAFHIFFSKELSPARQKYAKWIFGLSDKTILLTQSWQKWYKETINMSKSIAIYNGVNNYFDIKSLPLDQRKNILLFLGRLSEKKGIYDLLYSFKEVVKEVPSAMLKIAGDGEIEKCKQLVKKLEIDTHVEFLGWVDEEEKYRLLNEAKVFVLPSYNEGLPMGLLEAMSAGIAIVATKVGGIPEAIENEKNGLLIEPCSEEQIYKSIISLLKNSDKTIEIGMYAKERFKNSFDIVNIAQEIEREYYALF